MHHFAGCLLASYPQKHFNLQFALSLHTLSLSHTALTNKTHMKYKIQKIEHNYNQIWHGIKANKTHSCKLQFYNICCGKSDEIKDLPFPQNKNLKLTYNDDSFYANFILVLNQPLFSNHYYAIKRHRSHKGYVCIYIIKE